MRLVLASASPRRKELLAQIALGSRPFEFDTLATNIDERRHRGESAADLVKRLAIEKSQAGFSHYDEQQLVVLGADTIVVLDDQVLGKPQDAAQAKEMLMQLSDRDHHVLTAVAATDADGTRCFLVATKVKFCGLTEKDILAYIATNEPFDKAGSYAIQGGGGCFVKQIEGSYSAVVGLPLVETKALLQQMQVL